MIASLIGEGRFAGFFWFTLRVMLLCMSPEVVWWSADWPLTVMIALVLSLSAHLRRAPASQRQIFGGEGRR